MAEKISKVTWDNKCKSRYLDTKGRFKGGAGERFDNCVRAVKNCATGVKDPDAFCAYLGRTSPRWPGKKSSLDRDSVLVERIAAFHYAKSIGESREVAAFYADEVEKLIRSGCEGCGCTESKDKEAIREPLLHELSDFSKRPKTDDELALEAESNPDKLPIEDLEE